MHARHIFVIMCLVLFLLPIVFAEVPEHSPSWDSKCKTGFQWSRGTASCKQADCPAGVGRTYTYDCKCPPNMKCCYENGLMISVMGQYGKCPSELVSVPPSPDNSGPEDQPTLPNPPPRVVDPNIFGTPPTPTEIGNLPCNDSRRIKHDLDILSVEYTQKVKVNPHTYLLAPFGGMRGVVNNVFRVVSFGWGGRDYVCGAYQGKVLDMLEAKLAANDKLVQCLDFGPIQAKGGIHQAVVVYPKGTDWHENGTVFDPWYTQSHAVYTILSWNIIALGSAAPSSYYSKFPLYGNSYQTTTSSSNAYTTEEMAVLKYLNDQNTQNEPAVKAMLTEFRALGTVAERQQWLMNHRNIVAGHSPGNYVLTDRYGRSSGVLPDGTVVDEIPGIQFMQYQEDDGTKGIYYEVPYFADLKLEFSADKAGQASVFLVQANPSKSGQMYKYVVPVTKGDSFQYALPIANAVPGPLEYGTELIQPMQIPKNEIITENNPDANPEVSCCLSSGVILLICGLVSFAGVKRKGKKRTEKR